MCSTGAMPALAVLLALGTFGALAFLLMDLQLRPQIREWGQARARYLATQAINQAISQELEENGDEYQDLVRFEKDQFGQILRCRPMWSRSTP